jgi:hypothetical protein
MSCPICLEDFNSLRSAILVGDCGHFLCAQCLMRLYHDWSTDAPSRERAVLSLIARYNLLTTADTLPPINQYMRTIAFACPSCPSDAVSAAPVGWISHEACAQACAQSILHIGTIDMQESSSVTAMATISHIGTTDMPESSSVTAIDALSRAALFSSLLVDADDAPLVCPQKECGALLAAPRTRSVSTEPTVGRPRDCGHCGNTLCIDCGVPWTTTMTGAGVDTASLSHSHFSTCNAIAEELAFRSEVLPSGTKQCPGCSKVVSRLRNDACHNVTCEVCTMHFCIVCLTPTILFGVVEHQCPHTCNHNACDCDFDPLETPETAEIRAARLISQAQGIADWRRAYPKWKGPVTAASVGARRVAKAVRNNELSTNADGDSGDEGFPVDHEHTGVYRALRRLEEGSQRSIFSLAAAARAFYEGDGCTLKDQLDRSHRPAEFLAFLNGRADDVSASVPPGGLSAVRAQVLTNVCAMLSSSQSQHAHGPKRATALLSTGRGNFFGLGATDTVSNAQAFAVLFKKIGLMLVNKKLTRETVLVAVLVFSAVPNDAILQWLDDGLSRVTAEKKVGVALADMWLASVLHFFPPLLALRVSTGNDQKLECDKDILASLLLRLERFASLASGRPDIGGVVLKALTLSFSQPEPVRTILHSATILLAPTLIADRAVLIDLMVTTAREDAWIAAASLAKRLHADLEGKPLTQSELLVDIGSGETLLSLALASREYERGALGSTVVLLGAKNVFPQMGKDGFADVVAHFIERADTDVAKIFGWED